MRSFLGHIRTPYDDERQRDNQMNDREHHRQWSGAGEQSPQIQNWADAETDNVTENDRITRGGRLRVASRPVQNCDPQQARAEHPKIGDQCGWCIRWHGTGADGPWSEYEPEAEEREINSSDTEQYIEFHKQSSLEEQRRPHWLAAFLSHQT